MSQQTNTKQGDTLRTQNNAEETPNEKSTSHNEPILGTPFWIRSRNNKWFITFADQRITEPTDNKETTVIKLENEKWDIITQIIAYLTEKIINIILDDTKKPRIQTEYIDTIKKEKQQ